MFLIAGISPKIKIIDNNPRRCPSCGSGKALTKRADHYLSLFFIPLIKVKTGEVFISCEKCEKNIQDFWRNKEPAGEKIDARCRQCNRVLEKRFKFCPNCGIAR